MRSRLFASCTNALAVCEPLAIQYLEEKYGEAFEITASRGAGWGTPNDRYWVRPVSAFDDTSLVADETALVFAVYGNQNRTPSSVRRAQMPYRCAFSDAYYSVLILPAYQAFVDQLVNERLPGCVAQVTLNRDSPNPDGLTAAVPLTEIYRFVQPDRLFTARITLSASSSALRGENPDQAVRYFAEGIADARLMAWITLRVQDENVSAVCCVKPDYTVGACTAWTYMPQVTAEVFAEAETPTLPEPRVLTDWQLERLCSLVYLDGLLTHRDTGTLGEIADYLLTFGLDTEKVNGKLPCEMSEDEWRTVLRDIRADADIAALRVIKTVDVTNLSASDKTLPGHRAVAFADNMGNTYAVFRGTCGDDEWYDNALGMVRADTVQQQASARFVMELKAQTGVRRIITAGHSKGGNKAQYAAITTPDGYVERCFSLDGQGFSHAFMHKYRDAVTARKERIHLAAERRDFVNCLGLYLTDGTTYYIGRRGDPAPGAPHGEPMPYFHCPDALRDSANRIGPVSTMKPISETLNRLIDFFLTDDRYEKRREDTAVDLIALMMRNKRASTAETAEALVNIGVVFMELACETEAFRDQVMLIFRHEPQLLLATFESVAHPHVKMEGALMGDVMVHAEEPAEAADAAATRGLAAYVVEILARRIVNEPDVRKYFIGTLKHLVLLVKDLLHASGAERTVLNYVFAFVENILKRLATGAAHKTLSLVLACWRKLIGRTQMHYMNDSAGKAAQVEESNTDTETDMDSETLLMQLALWSDTV